MSATMVSMPRTRAESYDLDRSLIIRSPVWGPVDLAWWLMMRNSSSAERFRRRNLKLAQPFDRMHRTNTAARLASLIRHRCREDDHG